ncbi:uncharacterized protein EV422DRAFT_539010 [Fimicolochytrium jonesii]|uniref:uncharacterized protein n=1 Tax=Fimicolochytrium jonesii TaxID=1396493 RepID=UPI0022FED156|nr:uncharacterized protein EV422DRAFT_539010 [Fimicolochytrium jonesii]KAI8818192.1 hypothetical protein EV422DRAFT_539010 [Fimicolochytrium jonesii]
MYTDSRRPRGSGPHRRGGRAPRTTIDKEFLIFGYGCRLFRDDALAGSIERGDMLQAWRGTVGEGRVMIDRYDVRNLLDDLSSFPDDDLDITGQFQSPREPSPPIVIEVHDDSDDENTDTVDPQTGTDKELDHERYQDLDSEEETLFDMSEDERDLYVQNKRRMRRMEADGKRWAHRYGSSSPSSEEGVGYEKPHPDTHPPEEDTVQPSDLPYPPLAGMRAPSTLRLASIIEKTAKFIAESTNPQTEFMVKAKQASNPEFDFLQVGHELNAYYVHVRGVMKSGLVGLFAGYGSGSGSESEGGEEDVATAPDPIIPAGEGPAKGLVPTGEVGDTAHTTATLKSFPTPAAPEPPPPTPIDPTSPPPDLQTVIQKLATFVARAGPDLEQKVKAKHRGDPRFAFLVPWNPWHAYYVAVRDQARDRVAGNTVDGGGAGEIGGGVGAAAVLGPPAETADTSVTIQMADTDAGSTDEERKAAKRAQARAALDKVRGLKLQGRKGPPPEARAQLKSPGGEVKGVSLSSDAGGDVRGASGGEDYAVEAGTEIRMKSSKPDQSRSPRRMRDRSQSPTPTESSKPRKSRHHTRSPNPTQSSRPPKSRHRTRSPTPTQRSNSNSRRSRHPNRNPSRDSRTSRHHHHTRSPSPTRPAKRRRRSRSRSRSRDATTTDRTRHRHRHRHASDHGRHHRDKRRRSRSRSSSSSAAKDRRRSQSRSRSRRHA